MMSRILLAGVLAAALVLAPAPVNADFDVLRVTLATSATLVYTNTTNTGVRVLVRNPGAVSVYVGPAGVTTSTGFEIAAGDAAAFPIAGGDSIYGVVTAGTQVVHRAVGAAR